MAFRLSPRQRPIKVGLARVYMCKASWSCALNLSVLLLCLTAIKRLPKKTHWQG